MTRDISNETVKGINSDGFAWVIALMMDLDGGIVYVHTGVGKIEFNGAVWRGVGNLAKISGFSEAADGGDDRINVGLSGIPVKTMPDFVEELSGTVQTGRDWSLHLVILDSGGDVYGSPDEISSGITGAADLIDGPEKTVTLSLITEAALMRAVLFFRFTNEDQQLFFPGDTAFQYVGDLSDELRWGSADPRTITRDKYEEISDTRGRRR